MTTLEKRRTENIRFKNEHKNKFKNETRNRPFQNGRFYEDDKSHLGVTIAVPPKLAYSFFRNFQNLPLFMKDLKSIDVISKKISHWVMEIKGVTVEWNSEIVEERPGEMISWKSMEESEIENSGSIWFAPAPEDLGTVVSLILDYKIPGGKVAELFTKISLEDPRSLAFINLRRFKCLLETGEVATIKGQSSGRSKGAENILKH